MVQTVGKGDVLCKAGVSNRALTEADDIECRKSCEELAESLSCFVCGLGLSTMTLADREAHVNECMDSKSDTCPIASTRDVRACPICLSSLSTSVERRVTHLKRCSQDQNISTENLLRLLKEECRAPSAGTTSKFSLHRGHGGPTSFSREQSRISVEPDADFQSPEVVLITQTSLHRKPGRPVEIPIDFDEDLQTAIALSESLSADVATVGHFSTSSSLDVLLGSTNDGSIDRSDMERARTKKDCPSASSLWNTARGHSGSSSDEYLTQLWRSLRDPSFPFKVVPRLYWDLSSIVKCDRICRILILPSYFYR